MSMKHITDAQVCEAYRDAASLTYVPGQPRWPYELLAARTGQPEKVCYRCCERACDRGYVEYGVSLRSGWLTDEGRALIGEPPQDKAWQRPEHAVQKMEAAIIGQLLKMFGIPRP